MCRLRLSSLLCLLLLSACGESRGAEPGSSEQPPIAEVALASQALVSDRDGDGVPDSSDNCPDIANADQANRNEIEAGDACELSLSWTRGLLTHYARFQSHKELVVWFSPLLLTGAPDLMRISAPANNAVAHLSLLTRRLGVRSGNELWPGQIDTISGNEVLRVQLGEDRALGAAKAARVWLRVEGTANVSVTFFRASQQLGTQVASSNGTAWLSFALSDAALFDRIELRAQSGSFGLRGQTEGIVFALASALTPCANGYERVGSECVDINECAGLARVCDALSSCINVPGSFSCGPCPQGYHGTGATACVDIDECAEDPASCSPLSTCSNTVGGYQCGACPAGYAGDGHTCSDVDECAAGTHACDALVTCTNREGGYDCGSCPSGYAGGGQTGCVDIDECSGDNHACDSLTTCSNEPGSFTCGACPAGYRGTGATSCVDVDECAEGTSECSPLAACANTAGGYQCGACPAGYVGDGRICDDVDECADHSAQCSTLVNCENSVGSYHCGACPAGYSGDGFTCLDVDECQDNPCDARTSCGNTQGAFTCSACPDGFTGNGYTGCVDIDECAAGSDACSPLVTCANTTGSYGCAPCPAGYRGDGYTCADIDECSEQSADCAAIASCTNTAGSYQCGECPAGYAGDGHTCTDIDECLGNPCDPLSACQNVVGSYQCGACPSGYSGDGYAGCVDIDECAIDDGGCPLTEGCENLPGSMRCVACPTGSVGVVTHCGVGVCAASGLTRCERGVVVDGCAPGVPAISDTTCDQRDDDCDGNADEDFIVQPSSCGIGACSAQGVRFCAAGHIQDSCVPGSITVTQDLTCNNIDDDCDGSTDEDFSGVCSASSAQVCVAGQIVQASNCTDSFVCNGSESCSAGRCVHSGPQLDDANPCTTDACSESTGITHTDRPFAASCSDGNDCNGSELCLPCRESENLILNGGFERVWANNVKTEGLMPTDFWGITNTPDTYSFDSSWGLGRGDFGHFVNMTSIPDGVRWVVGYSGDPERIAQELREPLVSGQRYRISAKLFRANTYPAPGGYDVFLASDYTTTVARPNDLLLGYLGATTQTGWIDVTFEFTAPANIGTRRLLVLSPRAATAGQFAHTGLDALKLVRSCAASGGRSCQRQDAPVIDDGLVCTTDVCSNAGGVAHVPLATGTACHGSGVCSASGQCSNRPPVFTSQPAPYYVLGAGNYQYQASASDADGDTIVFSRGEQATCTWTITSAGAITSLSGTTGRMCVLHVKATDSHGAVTSQTNLVQIISIDPSPPMVYTQPAQHAVVVGAQFSYRPRVWSRDPAAVKTVAISAGPAGLSVDSSGLITWTPSAAQLGTHEVALLITTPFGNVPHAFVVSVLAPN